MTTDDLPITSDPTRLWYCRCFECRSTYADASLALVHAWRLKHIADHTQDTTDVDRGMTGEHGGGAGLFGDAPLTDRGFGYYLGRLDGRSDVLSWVAEKIVPKVGRRYRKRLLAELDGIADRDGWARDQLLARARMDGVATAPDERSA